MYTTSLLHLLKLAQKNTVFENKLIYFGKTIPFELLFISYHKAKYFF